MYRVEMRYQGAALWNTALLPVSIQVAQTQAKSLSRSLIADEARVVEARPQHQVDIRA